MSACAVPSACQCALANVLRVTATLPTVNPELMIGMYPALGGQYMNMRNGSLRNLYGLAGHAADLSTVDAVNNGTIPLSTHCPTNMSSSPPTCDRH